MSKMKHLLRKLHIGGGLNDHDQRLGEIPPVTSPNPNSSSSTSYSSSLPSSSGAIGRVGALDLVGDRTSGEDIGAECMDFSFLEEEFQVQLAMAISVSDPDVREDPESAQIDAAKRMSLMCSPSVNDGQALVEFLTLQYWSYSVVNYDEKVMDGFYDVYGITSNLVPQGKMPLLVDLQARSVSGAVDYEVVLVNRMVDPDLRWLEKQAYTIFMDCKVSEHGVLSSGLVQRIAYLVVNRMGGPIGDSDEILRRWTIRSYELQSSLNTTILPLGHLDIGLSRHRALLFKVLADRINLPCKLVKGGYYTGTDDGAVNLIKIDDGSEYIIDLMGSPGSLIPSEAPNSQLQNDVYDIRRSAEVRKTPIDCLAHGEGAQTMAILSDLDGGTKFGSSMFHDTSGISFQTKEEDGIYLEEKRSGNSGHEFGTIPVSHHYPCETLSRTCEKALSDQVSGAHESNQLYAGGIGMNGFNPSRIVARPLDEVRTKESSLSSEVVSCRSDIAPVNYDEKRFQDNIGRIVYNNELRKESSPNLREEGSSSLHVVCDDHSERINPVLGEVAEWEISWDDLQIGERIGIGSYGEVYRAEWNGTKVAVKKFLAQDLSGDTLIQFKSEVEIMLRLRHPNVVLFMGAVTRPPHFSILTQFIPRGSLYKLLHRPNSQLDEKRRLKMALDVAKGMNYLHTSNPTIVHRDLKSPNLLVDKNWIVKVCDFGLSRIKHHTFLSSKSTGGTPEWMAPEVLRNEPANEKCDVYSFGVILWELATCSIPWKGLNPMQVVGAVGFQNRRLEIPEDVDPAVSQIICDCWQTEAHLRPSFYQLMSQIRHLDRLLVDRTASQNQRAE